METILWSARSDAISMPQLGVLHGRARSRSDLSRLNSSTAITTTTGRPCFSTVTGAACARSIRRPKPYLASFAIMLRVEPPMRRSGIMAKLATLATLVVGALPKVFWLIRRSLKTECSGNHGDGGSLLSQSRRSARCCSPITGRCALRHSVLRGGRPSMSAIGMNRT